MLQRSRERRLRFASELVPAPTTRPEIPLAPNFRTRLRTTVSVSWETRIRGQRIRGARADLIPGLPRQRLRTVTEGRHMRAFPTQRENLRT